MSFNRNYFFLLLFVVIGAIIRFHNIGFQYTNWDENFTINLASSHLPVVEIIRTSLYTDYTPPIYYLMAHFSMAVFGDTATAIRIPSVILGILLIPVMFLIGKEYKDELFGLLLAGFTTIYYNGYFYSKYGRSYSADLFFFSLVFYFFMRVLKGDKHSSVYFGIFSVLAIWTHMYTAIPISIMVLYLVWKRWECGMWPFDAGTVITASGALLLAYFYVPLLLQTRIAGVGSDTFGATPMEILFVTPIDIFGYSVFAILPVVIWTLWKHHDDEILRLVSVVSLATWASMFIISVRTPILLHYSIFLVPMLLLAFILPFWEQIKKGEWYMRYVLVAVMVLVLECYQIFLLNFVQRLGQP